jgi:hypothetical protein
MIDEPEIAPEWLGADLIALATAFLRTAESKGTANDIAKAVMRVEEARRLVAEGMTLTKEHVARINALKAEIGHEALRTVSSADFVAAVAAAWSDLAKQFPFGPDFSRHPRSLEEIVKEQADLDERATGRADAREARDKDGKNEQR